MKSSLSTYRTPLIIIWILVGTIACNLGASNAPPTLVPRATNTPAPTLGYAPGGGPTGVPGVGNAPIPAADLELLNLINQVEADRLMFHVSSLQSLQTRHVNSGASGIGAAYQYIMGQFDAISQTAEGRVYAFPMEFDSNAYDQVHPQRNIVAVIQGTQAGGGIVVIGAHYDSIGSPIDSATAYAPGANDNGTGVAAVIELARIMSQRQYKSTVMFVLFSAEEVGRQGSKVFAQWVQQSNQDVIAMFNIDTIGNIHDRNGRVNDQELRIFSAGPNDNSISRDLARMVNFIGFNFGLDLELTVQDAIDRENRYGDHQSFSEIGYPAIRFINAFEEKTNADPTDTIQFIEAEYLKQSTQALLAVATALADGIRPPTNITLRDRGNGVNTLVWEPIPGAISYVIALRLPGSLYFNQQIEVTENSIEWDKFSQYAGIAIAAKGPDGLVGPLSKEIEP